jgi:NADH-quinone oxidoreductase subunit F
VGRDVTFEEIDRDFDAIFVAVGAHKSLPLGVPGEEASGVYGAVEWLRAYNTTGNAPMGKRVAVVGGGNSAVDAARVAKRLGAESVTVYYRRMRGDMPAQKAEIHAAEAEGIEIAELVAPASVVAENGGVGGLQMRRMELRGFDRSGRKQPVPIAGSEFTVAVDTVLSAVSQAPALDFLDRASVGTRKATVEVDRSLRTANPKVWAGGDAVTGPAMVIDAIRAGQRAAHAIDASIRQAAGEQPWVAPDDEAIEIPVDVFDVDDEATERLPAVMPAADPESRRRDFREVELGYSVEAAMAEAARCMRCDLTAKKNQAVETEGGEAVAAATPP